MQGLGALEAGRVCPYGKQREHRSPAQLGPGAKQAEPSWIEACGAWGCGAEKGIPDRAQAAVDRNPGGKLTS